MATLVYRYGIRTRVDRARYQMPTEVWDEQLRLAHEMRNQLVALEYAHQEREAALWSSYPAVAAAEQELADIDAQLEKLFRQARDERSIDRTTAARADTATQIKHLQAAAKVERHNRKTARDAAKAVAKPQLEALKTLHRAAMKECRQQFSARGLYWATYNAVLGDHSVRVQLVTRAWKEGRPARLRYRRWDGTGTVSVQLQRASGDPQRTPEVLASGEGKWRNVLQIRPWMAPEEFNALPLSERRQVARAGEVVWSVGGGRTVTLPIVVHRMIPADADICEAQVTISKTAGQWTASLAVTVKLADPAPAEGRPVVAVHTGWRKRPDESVRVATWVAGAALHVPDSLADIAVAHDGGRWGELVIPAAWLDIAGHPAALRSIRDLAFDPLRDKLAAWLDEHPEACDERLTPANVRKWRAPARLAALRWRWCANLPAGAEELYEELSAWRVQDRHLWEGESHERAQITMRRDDAWRRVGAWLACNAGILVVDDTNLAALRKKSDVADTDPMVPELVAARARARAALVAPGRLRQLLKGAAQRRGVAVHTVDAKYVTRTHRECAHTAPADPRYAAAALVACPNCGMTYDQDHNAGAIMLDRALAGLSDAS